MSEARALRVRAKNQFGWHGSPHPSLRRHTKCEYAISHADRGAYILHMPAATAAALPPELPPAERPALTAPATPSGPEGLYTRPKCECSLADLPSRHMSAASLES